jgi:hypothetical protein
MAHHRTPKHKPHEDLDVVVEKESPTPRPSPRRARKTDPWSGEHILYGILVGLLIGAVMGFALGRASKPDAPAVAATASFAPAPMTITPDMMQRVPPPTQSTGGVDAYGRPPGDPHYGHNHP